MGKSDDDMPRNRNILGKTPVKKRSEPTQKPYELGKIEITKPKEDPCKQKIPCQEISPFKMKPLPEKKAPPVKKPPRTVQYPRVEAQAKAAGKKKIVDVFPKSTGSPINLQKQLIKFIPKLPKITFNKETLICAVMCTKDWILENCNPKKMSGQSGSGRSMKFPYTFSAKFAQFPVKHYINNQWIWKYYFVSVAVCLPLFYSINKLANSPGNVAKWAEIRRKEAAEHHH